MEKKELDNIYLNLLKEEGYKGEVDEDGDIRFKYEGETYWITPDEDDSEFFDLYFAGNWEFEDDGDKIKGLHAVNTVNRGKKLVKMHMDGENDLLFVHAGFFVQEPKDFIRYFSRSLGMIQGAINLFVEEMEKE
jgi:hypothetical protein